MSENNKLPKYQHIADLLRSAIRTGKLGVGDRLPSFAQMYRDHGATATTMRRVYELLEKDNLIERRSGSGVYVAEPTNGLTGNVGVIGREVAGRGKTHFGLYLLNGIEKFTTKHNQHMLFLDSSGGLDEDGIKKVDGLLLLNDERQSHQLSNLPKHLPRVSLFRREDDVVNVITDEQSGGKQATSYLIEQGHRRIACLMEELPDIPAQRLLGYKDALEDARIAVVPEWMRLTPSLFAMENHSNYLEWGRQNMQEWLRQGWADMGCTALLVQNDEAAIGVMQVLAEEGIKVPDRVSVMAFDGTDLCDHVSPRLCSMKLPFTEIGYKAAEILHQQIYLNKIEIQTVMLPMTLRPGESVAKILTE